MGSKRKGIMDQITEGKEIGQEAKEVGADIVGDGKEIKSILDRIRVVDEDDQSSIEHAESGYARDTKAEFKNEVDTKKESEESIEKGAVSEATEGKELNDEATDSLGEIAGITDVGRNNAETAIDKIRAGTEEYESQISDAEETIADTQNTVDSLRDDADSIFGA